MNSNNLSSREHPLAVTRRKCASCAFVFCNDELYLNQNYIFPVIIMDSGFSKSSHRILEFVHENICENTQSGQLSSQRTGILFQAQALLISVESQSVLESLGHFITTSNSDTVLNLCHQFLRNDREGTMSDFSVSLWQLLYKSDFFPHKIMKSLEIFQRYY